MRIGYLGCGTWGFCLIGLLASKGFEIIAWTTKQDLCDRLNRRQDHPLLAGYSAPENVRFTTNLQEVLDQSDVLVESVTSAGLRPVLMQIREIKWSQIPFILTSKGIEQNSLKILPEVVVEVLGEDERRWVGFLSGPSYAQEVIKGLPASVVGTAYDYSLMRQVCDIFSTQTFRVYPNSDVKGVAFGGALKNVIAIACGISEGLELGCGAKAALMTRGLHEIRKLGVLQGCKAETLNGLSGMGDLCHTCGSLISRNSRFGYLIAKGRIPAQAYEEIGMVVEGAYTCVSALELSRQCHVAMPIAEMVYKIVHQNMPPKQAVAQLMQRTVKEEHL